MGTQVPRYMPEFHRPKLSTGPLDGSLTARGALVPAVDINLICQRPRVFLTIVQVRIFRK